MNFSRAVIVFITLIFCQIVKADDLKDKIEKEAKRMANTLINKNIEEFIKYLYPPILMMMGGRDNAIELYRQKLPEGRSFTKVEFSYPSDTIMVDNEIQCTMKETLELKIPEGKLILNSSVIAISNDNGKIWFFIEANNKSISELRIDFPNLSDRLIIEPKSQPIYIKN